MDSLQVHMCDDSEMCHSAQLLQQLQWSLFDQFYEDLPFFYVFIYLFFYKSNLSTIA